MNRLSPVAHHSRPSRRLLAGSIATAFVLFAGAGTAVRAADIAGSIRTSDDARSFLPTIQATIADAVKTINNDDPKEAAKARESLVGEVNGLTEPSSSFLDVYCGELGTQLLPLSNPATHPNVRVRLNVAIVVSRVAEKTADARLTTLVEKELADPNEGVVRWALKAARFIIPPAVNVGMSKQIVPLVTKAAHTFDSSGSIMEVAYGALTPAGTKDQQLFDAVTGPVQDLLDWRIKKYSHGTPAEPSVDSLATSFLTEKRVWIAEKSLQQRTVQLLANLISAATMNVPKAQGDDANQLNGLLAQCGKAIWVIGLNGENAALVEAAKPLSGVVSGSAPTPPAQVAADAQMALSALATAYTGLHLVASPTTNATSPVP